MNIIIAEVQSTNFSVSTDVYNIYIIFKSNFQFISWVQWSLMGNFLTKTLSRYYNKFEKVCNFVTNRSDLTFFADLICEKM